MGERVGRRWDQVSRSPIRNWWHSDKCRDYVNRQISPVAGSLGPIDALRQAYPGRIFGRAVSVGCGTGAKELKYLTEGVVGHFDLWDLAENRLETGRADAERSGVSERATFNCGDAFVDRTSRYDLIHWDHSLHHMSDVRAALLWSREVATDGAVIMINDYVGANRLQYPDKEVDAANEFLRHHGLPGRVPRSNVLTRMKMWRRDPSEAPQSERIVEAARELGYALRPIGGMMLNILGPLVAGRLPDEDERIDALIQADQAARQRGQSHFAFGLLS